MIWRTNDSAVIPYVAARDLRSWSRFRDCPISLSWVLDRSRAECEDQPVTSVIGMKQIATRSSSSYRGKLLNGSSILQVIRQSIRQRFSEYLSIIPSSVNVQISFTTALLMTVAAVSSVIFCYTDVYISVKPIIEDEHERMTEVGGSMEISDNPRNRITVSWAVVEFAWSLWASVARLPYQCSWNFVLQTYVTFQLVANILIQRKLFLIKCHEPSSARTAPRSPVVLLWLMLLRQFTAAHCV